MRGHGTWTVSSARNVENLSSISFTSGLTAESTADVTTQKPYDRVASPAMRSVTMVQYPVSFLGPCCPAPLYCIAVHDCLMLIEQINDDDADDDEYRPTVTK